MKTQIYATPAVKGLMVKQHRPAFCSTIIGYSESDTINAIM